MRLRTAPATIRSIMTRRKSLIAVPAAAAALPAAGRAPSILELRYFQLRNGSDMQSQRAGDFVKQTFMPALSRAGGKVHGVFSNLIAPNGPFILVLSSFSSMAVFDSSMDKLNADKQYMKELEALDAKGGLSFVRMESNLLRAFPTMPDVEGSATEGKPARVFELRTYESNSPVTLQKKIRMFEEGGETAIFRRVGLTPVFFGETIAGQHMPNLTYMLVYDNLAAREKNWAAFVSDPAWLKLRATPGLSDAEIVSNISNTLLRPLPFSPIR
jgi:hypothetical protein